jgi:hypothetical protein
MCDGSGGSGAMSAPAAIVTGEPMARKRKVNYPPAKTANRPPPATGAPGDAPYVRQTVATINLSAAKGQKGLAVGSRVRIIGTGLYANEAATIEKLVNGVIPQAVVRTDAGKHRQVRTIDLEPLPPGTPRTVAEPAAAEPAASATEATEPTESAS